MISGICKKDKIPKILSMILIQQANNITYNKIFDYLYDNYKFKIKIIYNNKENALIGSLKENKYINKRSHYIQQMFFSLF